ncbi:hypothetical protein, partial [Rufibacter soli]
MQKENLFLPLHSLPRGGPRSRQGGEGKKKKFPEALAERELVLTFAAPSERKPWLLTERPREGKKSFEKKLAKRESLLTFAAASAAKHPGRKDRE